MDVDQLSETKEASTGTEDAAAMDTKNIADNTSVAGNTNAENDIRDNIGIAIHQNENKGGCDICHTKKSAGITKLPSIFHVRQLYLHDRIHMYTVYYHIRIL